MNDDEGDRFGLRERRRRSTRRRIQREALVLFGEQGFDETTIDQISTAAEVSRTSVFRYFRTKDDIVFAPEDELLERLLRFMGEDRASGLARVLVRFAEHVDGTEHDLRQRASIIRRSPKLRVRFARVRVRWEVAVADQLAARSGAATPTLEHRVRAGTAMATLFAALLVWAHEPAGALSDAVRQAIAAVPHTFPADGPTGP